MISVPFPDTNRWASPLSPHLTVFHIIRQTSSTHPHTEIRSVISIRVKGFIVCERFFEYVICIMNNPTKSDDNDDDNHTNNKLDQNE